MADAQNVKNQRIFTVETSALTKNILGIQDPISLGQRLKGYPSKLVTRAFVGAPSRRPRQKCSNTSSAQKRAFLASSRLRLRRLAMCYTDSISFSLSRQGSRSCKAPWRSTLLFMHPSTNRVCCSSTSMTVYSSKIYLCAHGRTLPARP